MKNVAFQYIYHAYNSDKIWPPLSEPRFPSPLSTLRLVSSFSGVQSGVETSIRRSRFQHVSTAANCILHGCSAIMCTWPGRTKAYSETALCAGLLHPSTTAPCRWDTNTGTSLRVTRMHASVHPVLRRFRPGFQSVSKTDLLLLHVSNSILVACHLLEQLAPFIVQWFREIVRLTSLGIDRYLTQSRHLDTRNGSDRSRRVFRNHFICTSFWEAIFSILWNLPFYYSWWKFNDFERMKFIRGRSRT